MILTAFVSLILSYTNTETESISFYTDYQQIANAMMENYDFETPKIEFGPIEDHSSALAATICYMRDDGPECVIRFRPCTMGIDMQYRENLIAHEIAHYINAREYGNFDHGARWRMIMRQNGYIPHEYYTENVTESCSHVDVEPILAR